MWKAPKFLNVLLSVISGRKVIKVLQRTDLDHVLFSIFYFLFEKLFIV